MHGRCRESSRVALPVRRGFHGLGFVSADVALAVVARFLEVLWKVVFLIQRVLG